MKGATSVEPIRIPESPVRSPGSAFSRRMAFLAIIGPGVLGLAADNDAGGILSYVVTGATRHLLWFIPALLVMAPVTYFIQELALRVAIATEKPFVALITQHFGRWPARLNASVLHALNLLTLTSEFVGMTLSLSWFGVPWRLGLGVSLTLVVLTTRLQDYHRMERLLLICAGLTFALVPVCLLLDPSPARLVLSLGSIQPGAQTPFLLLALAGNAVAPWMIYWQQSATWAGATATLARGRADIRLGIAVQTVMATLALAIGALAGPGAQAVPIAGLTRMAGPAGRLLFAAVLFDAGFIAAVTIGLSSSWMIRELLTSSGISDRQRTPTQGTTGHIHLATLAVSAGLVALPRLPSAGVALWAQAASGLVMPVSLFFLVWVAIRNRRMGAMRMHRRRTLLFIGIIAGFAVLGGWTIGGIMGAA